MTHVLPKEIIYNILTYTGKFKIRNGYLSSIVSKDDPRYNMLQNIPKELPLSSHYFVYIELKIKHNSRERKTYRIIIDLRKKKIKTTICVILTTKDCNNWNSFNTYSFNNYERI